MVSAVLCASGVMNRQLSTTTCWVTRQHIWHLTITPAADIEDSLAVDVKEGIPTQQLISKVARQTVYCDDGDKGILMTSYKLVVLSAMV